MGRCVADKNQFAIGIRIGAPFKVESGVKTFVNRFGDVAAAEYAKTLERSGKPVDILGKIGCGFSQKIIIVVLIQDKPYPVGVILGKYFFQ